jgi:mercuric ion transport protein
MNDRALIRAGALGAILAAICCAAPLLAVGLPLAGLGAWLAGAGLVVLPLTVAVLGLVAWSIRHRRAKTRT